MHKFLIKHQTAFLLLIIVIFHVVTASYFMFNKNSRDRSIFSTLPLDDAYVHFVYARNFAQYGLLLFNSNDPQTGATSPLYVIILSLFFKLGLGDYIVFIAKMIGIIFAIGTSFVVFYILKDLLRNIYFAFAGGLLIALSPFFNFAKISGMEVTLFSFLALLSIYFFMKDRLLLTGFFTGLAILARPEGYVLFFTLLLHMCIQHFKDIRTKNPAILKRVLFFIIPVFILLLPYITYCLLVTGKPLPNTYYVKHLPYKSVVEMLPDLGNSIYLFLTTFTESITKNFWFNLSVTNQTIISFSIFIVSLLFILPGIK